MNARIFIILLLCLIISASLGMYENMEDSQEQPSQEQPSQPPPQQPDYGGITYDQIPVGDQDLYILKSQIVPPVCPACPSVCPNGGSSEPPPPCPPCARCPEPAFDCKKVPNYSSSNSAYLPRPVLADFSQFD